MSLLTHQLSKLIHELRYLKLMLRKEYTGCTDSWDPKPECIHHRLAFLQGRELARF